MLTLRTHLYAPTYQPDVPVLDEDFMNIESGDEVMDFMMHEINHSAVAYFD